MTLLLATFFSVLLWCLTGLIGYLLLMWVDPKPTSIKDFQYHLELGPLTLLLLLGIIFRDHAVPVVIRLIERRIERKLDEDSKEPVSFLP